jgi:hypothetical protein
LNSTIFEGAGRGGAVQFLPVNVVPSASPS